MTAVLLPCLLLLHFLSVCSYSLFNTLLCVKNSLGAHVISLFSCSVVIFSKNCTWTLSILFFCLTCCFCFYFYYFFTFMYGQLLCCFFGTFKKDINLFIWLHWVVAACEGFSLIVVHGLSCPSAYGILPNQGLNLHLQHCQADS